MLLIELNNLSAAVEKNKYSDYEKESNSIGSVIKSRRCEMKKTLEEICKGICCVGFLSKLERNKLDNLNNPIVMKLCERLDLDYESLSKTKTKDELVNAISEYCFNRFESLKKRYELLNKEMFLSQNALIECLYYLSVEDYNSFNLKINKLDVVKKSMTCLELSCLLVLMINYYIKTYQFKKASEYLGYLDSLGYDEYPINILKREAKFYVSCNLDNKNIEYDYNNIKEYYDIGYPITKQFLLRLEYLKSMDNHDLAYKVLLSLEKEKISSCNNEFYYTKAYLLCSLKRFKEVCNLIIDKKCNAYKFITLFAYSLLHLRNSKMINDEIYNNYFKHLNFLIRSAKYKNEDSIHICFLKLMQMEIDNSSEMAIYNYLKSQILEDLKTFYVDLYNKYCINRYYELIGLLCKYKDAYILLEQFLDKKIVNM